MLNFKLKFQTLFRIESKEMNRRISQLVKKVRSRNNTGWEALWIGYTDRLVEGSFIDFEYKYPIYEKWGTNDAGIMLPDNALSDDGRGQNCALINFRLSELWDDHWCWHKFPSACRRKRCLTADCPKLPCNIQVSL